jgi:hypothetical protein
MLDSEKHLLLSKLWEKKEMHQETPTEGVFTADFAKVENIRVLAQFIHDDEDLEEFVNSFEFDALKVVASFFNLNSFQTDALWELYCDENADLDFIDEIKAGLI